MKKLDSSSSNLDAYDSDNSDNPLSFQFETPDPFSLVFRSVNSTLYVVVDSILVTDFVPDQLSAPANLDVSGTIGANDFAVTWGSVANAQGYSVKLLDANDGVVSSNDVTAATTSASFTGLTSSSAYKVVVVALGNHTTTDDSVPATLDVTTAVSSVAAPTLVVANTSWTAGVAGTSAVSATLEGGVDCMVASVSMSDGSSATVANGILSWTPPVSATASSVTATFHVTHGTDGWDLPQVLSVAATPAPGAPYIELSGATVHSFDASWSATAGGPVVSYKLRAWTGRETPDDNPGSTTEYFQTVQSGGSFPAGWIPSPQSQFGNYPTTEVTPVKFGNTAGATSTLESPVYPGTITALSFVVRMNGTSTASTFSVYGSSGEEGAEFELIQSYDATTFSTSYDGTTLTPTIPTGIHKFKFVYVKQGGNVGFGSVKVSGTNWPAADFLEGWGGAKISVGAATSQTISDPVAGAVNWVEVTAVGPTGLETSARASVSVPHVPPAVISIQ